MCIGPVRYTEACLAHFSLYLQELFLLEVIQVSSDFIFFYALCQIVHVCSYIIMFYTIKHMP